MMKKASSKYMDSNKSKKAISQNPSFPEIEVEGNPIDGPRETLAE
jgi:hypothetical protein